MDAGNQAREDLVRVFVGQYPDAAAQIVEQLNPESVARWLSDITEDQIDRLLERMLPAYTARILEALPVRQAARRLTRLSPTTAAAALRNCDNKKRRLMMDQLPSSNATQMLMLLNFAEDSVGAWMHSDILVLPEDLLVKDALERLESQTDHQESDVLLVLDRDRLLRGTVRMATLLRSVAETPISELVVQMPFAIPGRMSLQGAQHHEAWGSMQWVPVINRHRQFIGILRHVDLYRGLDHAVGVESKPRQQVVDGVVQLYGNTLLIMFNLVSELIFPASRGDKS